MSKRKLEAGRPTTKVDKLKASLKDTQEIIKMNVNIPKALHKKVKHKALDEDITVTEAVINLLEEWISK